MRKNAKNHEGCAGHSVGHDPRLAGLVARVDPGFCFALCLSRLGALASNFGQLAGGEIFSTREPPEAAQGDRGGVFGRLLGLVHGVASLPYP